MLELNEKQKEAMKTFGTIRKELETLKTRKLLDEKQLQTIDCLDKIYMQLSELENKPLTDAQKNAMAALKAIGTEMCIDPSTETIEEKKALEDFEGISKALAHEAEATSSSNIWSWKKPQTE